jgi:hypothetical protein
MDLKELVAKLSDLAVEMEKHSNDHIHDAMPDNLGAAVEGVCADRINAILKPYRAALSSGTAGVSEELHDAAVKVLEAIYQADAREDLPHEFTGELVDKFRDAVRASAERAALATGAVGTPDPAQNAHFATLLEVEGMIEDGMSPKEILQWIADERSVLTPPASGHDSGCYICGACEVKDAP